MKLDGAFKKLRFLRNDLPCRLTPTETVKVLVELLEEQKVNSRSGHNWKHF